MSVFLYVVAAICVLLALASIGSGNVFGFAAGMSLLGFATLCLAFAAVISRLTDLMKQGEKRGWRVEW